MEPACVGVRGCLLMRDEDDVNDSHRPFTSKKEPPKVFFIRAVRYAPRSAGGSMAMAMRADQRHSEELWVSRAQGETPRVKRSEADVVTATSVQCWSAVQPVARSCDTTQSSVHRVGATWDEAVKCAARKSRTPDRVVRVCEGSFGAGTQVADGLNSRRGVDATISVSSLVKYFQLQGTVATAKIKVDLEGTSELFGCNKRRCCTSVGKGPTKQSMGFRCWM